MEITEVRIKLSDGSDDRLMGFASISDGEIAIRDLRIIIKNNRYFVAMPSRKLTHRCGCGVKNYLRARFCHMCGNRLKPGPEYRDADGRLKFHADTAHPINGTARQKVEQAVLKAYLRELQLAKQPDYVCRYDAPHDNAA